jgi:hypothetical protein
MSLQKENELLTKSFRELGFGDDFLEQCQKMGLSYLDDLRRIKIADLMQKEGFSYLWLEKLSTYLRQKDMLHLLQQEPGNRNG